MPPQQFDIVVIGTGAGGGTVLRELAPTGARILVVERGNYIPSESQNWDPDAVWRQLRYRTTETWLDETGEAFRPYTHYCVGGNTKFWGSVLYRLRREDFGEVEHLDGVSPAWPIDYDTLEPYYERAERMYHVHGRAGLDPTEASRGPFPYDAVPHARAIDDIVTQLRAQGLHPSPLPLGLVDGCILCNTCNSFPCRIRKKGDSEVCGVAPALEHRNVTLWAETRATRLLTNASGTAIEAIEVEQNRKTLRVEAPLFVVSCGAVNSAALLLRSSNAKHPRGLANSSGLVGARYMAHLATMMQGFHPLRVNDTVFQKTVAINDFYFKGSHTPVPLGQIQSQGRTHGVMAQTVVPWMPLWAYNAWVARGVDWLAMTEDLPRVDNRVTVTSDGRIQLQYRPNNLEAHARLVKETIAILHRLGFWKVMTHSHKSRNTTHQCGTLVFGTDPGTSVLDPFCRSHDISNLFVVDASFFPSSAAVNPGLTIAAQALRVADHIKAMEL
jgi:choline dehydrogenase-like flavoprotein